MKQVRAFGIITPLATVLCLSVAGCGGTSRGSTGRAQHSVASHTEKFPVSASISGDYDGDDDYGTKLRGDADNDDSRKPKDRDNDSDSNGKSYFDSDDDSVRHFGRPADAVDRNEVARLVMLYFAAANAEDGGNACAMLVPSLAKSLPETLGGAAGPPYAQGNTCARVMSGVFAHYHPQLAAHAASLRVSSVRVDHGKGVAILAFKALAGRQIHVTQEGVLWRINGPLDIELP
jgi:hypothetical protein